LKKSKDIRTKSLDDLKAFLADNGEKAFRAKQIEQWLWQKHSPSFDDMSNLSKDLRELLKSEFVIEPSEIVMSQKSNDGTLKAAFKLYDGANVEGVVIPTENRFTACVSTQVGCSLDCKFCATGYLKRMRNMEAYEIVEQVYYLNALCEKEYGRRLTNIVYMGMGEPLLNYQNVLKSVDKITDPRGLGFSPKRITVSTSGVSKMIRKLADDGVKFNLAFSLHAAIDEKRSALMSINKKNPLVDVLDALKYFTLKSGKKVTFEYVALNKVNDTEEDAQALAKCCSLFKTKVNIINFNPIEQANFTPSTPKRLDDFIQHLVNKGVNVSVRKSRGKDIDAACGQLANKLINAKT
tara:strand:- start:792 stop:1844 length:1053 start_codon:yes stop_codon:yes gene_type:complete